MSNGEEKMTGTVKWISLLGKIKLFTNLGCLLYPLMTAVFTGLPLILQSSTILSFAER